MIERSPLGHDIAQSTRAMIQDHFEKGIPLEDMKNIHPANIERFHICMELLRLVEQDPCFEDRAWLRHVKHRTSSQIIRDVQMFEMVQEYMMPQRKARARYIVEKTAERSIKRAEAQGDVKNSIAAARLIADVNRLAENDEEKDDVKNTYILPTVLVGVEQIDESRRSYKDEARAALFKKYKATEDEMAILIRDKAEEKAKQYEEAEVIEDVPEESEE